MKLNIFLCDYCFFVFHHCDILLLTYCKNSLQQNLVLAKVTSLVSNMDPFPVSVPPGSTVDPSIVLEMLYVFPLHEPFRLSPTSGCHFLHDSWVSILTLPTYVLNYLCALHWLSQCFIYHMYNDYQQTHICRPGFTPSCLIHTSKTR